MVQIEGALDQMSISEEIEFPTKTLDDGDVIQFYHNEVEKLKEQK